MSAWFLVAFSLAALTALPAAAQSVDPMMCARALDGTPILVGMPVRETGGRDVGWVSLSQCNADPRDGKLRVRLSAMTIGEVKLIDLAGVIVTAEAVMLPLTEAEIARAPRAPPAG